MTLYLERGERERETRRSFPPQAHRFRQHRLNPNLIDAIRQALSQVRSHHTSASALITTAQGKFFSNGFDLAWAKSHGSAACNDRFHLMSTKFQQLAVDLLSLPVPTIAPVSGHASAAGHLLVLCHDFILMNKHKGLLYLNEVDIGIRIPDPFMALLRYKIASPSARRDVVLGAAKLTAEEAVRKGVIDSAHDDADETVNAAVRLAEELGNRRRNGNGKVYGEMRLTALSEVAGAFAMELERGKGKMSSVSSRL